MYTVTLKLNAKRCLSCLCKSTKEQALVREFNKYQPFSKWQIIYKGLLDWFIHPFYPQNGICIKNTNFGLKMMVKSGLEKFILKSLLHAGKWLFLLLNLWFWAKIFPFMQYGKLVSRMEGLQNKFLYTNFHHLFRPNGLFLDINSFLRVKTMYEQLI